MAYGISRYWSKKADVTIDDGGRIAPAVVAFEPPSQHGTSIALESLSIMRHAMIEGDVFRMAYRQQPFRAGDAVRITCGQLANITGIFVRTAANHCCVITIDGVQNGVSVILPVTSLELAAPRTEAEQDT